MEQAVYIFLTKSNSPVAQLVRRVLPGEWSHACLSLDPQLRYMFSFGARKILNPFDTGFKHESIFEGAYPKQKSMEVCIIKVPVTVAQLDKIKSLLTWFAQKRDEMKFNTRGMFLFLKKKGVEIENRFFCAEFVYYVLRESGVANFGMPRNLVTPNHFLKIKDSIPLYHGALDALQEKLSEAPAVSMQADLLTQP